MTRMVFCKKYKEELPGLAIPPLPGATGQEILKPCLKKLGKNGKLIKQCLLMSTG